MPLTYWGMQSSQGKLQWVLVFGKPRLSSLITLQAPSPQVLEDNEETRATAWKQLVLQTEQIDEVTSVAR